TGDLKSVSLRTKISNKFTDGLYFNKQRKLKTKHLFKNKKQF
ncbi:hypothetical protein M153_66960003, partial [Pseudoloma neurophilia]